MSAWARGDIYRRAGQALLRALPPMQASDPIVPQVHSKSLYSPDRVCCAPFACIRPRVCEIPPPYPCLFSGAPIRVNDGITDAFQIKHVSMANS